MNKEELEELEEEYEEDDEPDWLSQIAIGWLKAREGKSVQELLAELDSEKGTRDLGNQAMEQFDKKLLEKIEEEENEYKEV